MSQELSITADNCKDNYECRDLSYRTIRNIDFSTFHHTVSFYRSDFRGCIFDSVRFASNNFDLADFIGNSFRNVEFYRVNFGRAEIKNGYFYHCHFEENIYDDIAIHNCTFINCIFQNEQFHLTMNNCEFINCQLIDCEFDQCSTDTLSFKKCVFLKCELSTMHAENFKFEACTFRDAFLGICFLGTYLFKNTDINLINFKYRGKIVPISDSDYFVNFTNSLLDDGRYFEYFNLSQLWHGGNADISNPSFADILLGIVKESNPNVRDYNLRGMFDTIEFYIGSDCLPMNQLINYISVLHAFPISSIPAESRLMFLQYLYRLDAILSSLDFPMGYISSIPASVPCIATFHLKDTSRESAEEHIASLLDEVNISCFNGSFSKPYFDIISIREGSIILTIGSSLLLLLMAAKVVRSISSIVCEIRIEVAKTNKAIELINSSKTPSGLNKALSCVPNPTDMLPADKIHDILGKGYLQDLVINYILK